VPAEWLLHGLLGGVLGASAPCSATFALHATSVAGGLQKVAAAAYVSVRSCGHQSHSLTETSRWLPPTAAPAAALDIWHFPGSFSCAMLYRLNVQSAPLYRTTIFCFYGFLSTHVSCDMHGIDHL